MSDSALDDDDAVPFNDHETALDLQVKFELQWVNIHRYPFHGETVGKHDLKFIVKQWQSINVEGQFYHATILGEALQPISRSHPLYDNLVRGYLYVRPQP